MKRFMRLPSPAMVVAVAALLAAMGGSAYAAVVITGKNVRNNTLEGADIKNKSLHGRDVKVDSLGGVPIKEERLVASKIDASKLRQVPSSKVSDGAALHAVVGANGAVGRSRGASSATRTGEGVYQVIFDRDVRACAYSATLGDVGTVNPGTGQVATSGLASNVNAVRVLTRASDGTAADRPFHLVLSC
jgi:hypothetical protein